MPEVEVGTASLASAGPDRVAVILGLEPAWPGARVSGRASTVRGSEGDNLAIHGAAARGGEGETVVVDVDGDTSPCRPSKALPGQLEAASIVDAVAVLENDERSTEGRFLPGDTTTEISELAAGAE